MRKQVRENQGSASTGGTDEVRKGKKTEKNGLKRDQQLLIEMKQDTLWGRCRGDFRVKKAFSSEPEANTNVWGPSCLQWAATT